MKKKKRVKKIEGTERMNGSCFSFHFLSQFYGRAHNAKAFLKYAPLDRVRNLVRMIWFDQAPGRT